MESNHSMIFLAHPICTYRDMGALGTSNIQWDLLLYKVSINVIGELEFKRDFFHPTTLSRKYIFK